MDIKARLAKLNQPMLLSSLILAVFALVGTALVAMTNMATMERIAEVEKQALLDNIYKLVPKDRINNDLLQDTIHLQAPELSQGKISVYRARLDGAPSALILSPVEAPGYAGPIRLIVAVMADGSLGGVRVLAHKETPGLGDKIEESRSDWIRSFTGKSLSSPTGDKWKVKRDGGQFDQFTGATITPRSIVTKVRETLEFVQRQQDALYAAPVEPQP